MEHEFNVNKEIIEQFEDALKDLNEKIERFEKTRDNANLDDETKNSLIEVIKKLTEDRDKIDTIVKKMNAMNKRGENPYRDTDFKDSKFVSGYEKVSTDLKEIEKTITDLNNEKEQSSSKFVQEILSKRIEKLKKKRGKIEIKQRKIVNNAIKAQLKVLLKNSDNHRVNVVDKMIQSKSQKKIDIDGKVEKYNKEKEELERTKKILLSNKGLGMKIDGIKVAFKGMLNSTKLDSLKRKRGIVNNIEKHVIMRAAKPSLIQRMKNNASLFGRAIKKSFEEGVNTFKSFYQNDSHEETKAIPVK